MLNLKSNLLVSVIMPTLNRGKYLKKAIDSVLNQTYSNLELIIIDDYSTDNSDEIVSNYNDYRIKYIKNKSNAVIATSRNVGIRASKGELIAFLDSDDWWTANKIKSCLNFFNKEIDLIYHDLEIISNTRKIFGKKIIKTFQLKKPVLINLLLSGNIINNSSVIVRKKIIEKIGLIDENKTLVGSEDYNTWLKISSFTDQFLYLPKKLGYYRIHDQNISQKDMTLSYREATYKFLSILNRKQKIKLESNIKYTSGRFNFLNLNYQKAKKDLLFVMFNGYFKLKLKSLIMIIYILIRPKK